MVVIGAGKACIESVKCGFVPDVEGILFVEGRPAQTQVVQGIEKIGFAASVSSSKRHNAPIELKPGRFIAFKTGEFQFADQQEKSRCGMKRLFFRCRRDVEAGQKFVHFFGFQQGFVQEEPQFWHNAHLVADSPAELQPDLLAFFPDVFENGLWFFAQGKADVDGCHTKIGTHIHTRYRNEGSTEHRFGILLKNFAQFFLKKAGIFLLSLGAHSLKMRGIKQILWFYAAGWSSAKQATKLSTFSSLFI